MAPTTIPPRIPAISPDMGGAPLAIAMPRQSGKATKKTTKLDFKSVMNVSLILFSIVKFIQKNSIL
jgi:hypothetical protein